METATLSELMAKYENYWCPVCCQILRNPMRFEKCGHHCCSDCWPEITRVEPRCPYDNVPLVSSEVHVDSAMQREIESLTVTCLNNVTGCTWKGRLIDIKDHMTYRCDYVPVKCPNGCDVTGLQRRQLVSHLQDKCARRLIQCVCCNELVPFEAEVEHAAKDCQQFPVANCPNGCRKRNVTRRDMAEHLKNECPRQVTECSFAKVGCRFKGFRQEMAAHITDGSTQHLALVNDYLLEKLQQPQQLQQL